MNIGGRILFVVFVMLVPVCGSVYAQGKSAAAHKVEQDFQRAWKNADVTLKGSVF